MPDEFREQLLAELRSQCFVKSGIGGINIQGLSNASPDLSDVVANCKIEDLKVLPTTGLAHDHIRLGTSRLLLRIPRQSQMRLNAEANLRYQAACFVRMSAGGHTPKCHALIAPGPRLPMGALVVEFIEGKALSLPEDLPRAAEALASIHQLPLPPPSQRAPLINQLAPLAATFEEVSSQADFLPEAICSDESRVLIRQELDDMRKALACLGEVPLTLISFDAHPANFLVDDSGRAILVDLEKGRYGGAGFDLAHATLYTSTTWDRDSCCVLSPSTVSGFYRAWYGAMPPQLAVSILPYLQTMRRLMWLWSLTWCAMWTVRSQVEEKQSKNTLSNTEDWSEENSEAELIEHVRGRVIHYLDAETITRIADDLTNYPIARDVI